MSLYTLLVGDVLEMLAGLPDESVHAIVTDPPYELGFMGKSWDSTGIAYCVEMWRECLRVLKPGGYLLSFGGTRTYHRMACAIEDAGFEIRDQMQWIYGSGFPKSLDVSKAIDKAAGAEREVVGKRDRYRDGRERQDNGHTGGEFLGLANGVASVTAPATDAAKTWDGWGTALKPANEPICVARKPLIGTVVENVLQHGCGALNIDAGRIEGDVPGSTQGQSRNAGTIYGKDQRVQRAFVPDDQGRWPSNVVIDEVAAELLDEQTASMRAARSSATGSGFGATGAFPIHNGQPTNYPDSGGASRFFYCAKASREDRGEGNNHPTVKPTALMEYLVRLVAPPGAVILDPFAGSGTTLKVAVELGFQAIGIEASSAHAAIIHKRMSGITPPLDFDQTGDDSQKSLNTGILTVSAKDPNNNNSDIQDEQQEMRF